MEGKMFSVINRLMKINRGHKQLIDSRVAEIGIHRTQHRILMYLARKGRLPSQKQLAECFELTPAAISGAVGRLEADGYIKRELGPDSRFNEITITDSGMEIVERTREMFSRIDEHLFEGFSDEELEEFSVYLDRIILNMKGEA